MIRWNKGYRCHGNPQVVSNQIANLVQAHNLADNVLFL